MPLFGAYPRQSLILIKDVYCLRAAVDAIISRFISGGRAVDRKYVELQNKTDYLYF